jgi:membrane associated rhomboid family serine protease
MNSTSRDSSFSKAFVKIIQFVLIIWISEILNYMLGHRLSNFGSVVIAVITVFFYGSMFWGIFPLQVYISWEAHLFGFLAGIVAAWIFQPDK